MAIYRVTNLGGINNKVQPFIKKDGELTHCLNMYTDQIGAKAKRPGYVTFLGTADGSAVQSLIPWERNGTTSSYLYRASGSSIYYHDVAVGTGAWTLSGNGTISPGRHLGHAVLNDTFICGDGSGSTRHTTNGTSFTNTTLAPVGEFFTTEFRRVYIGGTASDLFWSVSNDATNWNTSGTSDSNSVEVDGPGKINGVFSSNDRVVATKTSGIVKRWDDYSMVTVPTKQGYTSPYSVREIEGYYLGLTRLGYYGYGGGRPELISNPIESQIYNNQGSAISGTSFDGAPAGFHGYLYQCAVGTITDGFTGITIGDAVQVYNFQTDEFYNYKYANFPTAFTEYRDNTSTRQFLFGSTNGQVYKISGTATSDNGSPIEATLQGFIHLGIPETDKLWKKVWAFANPGCDAVMMLAVSNSFDTSDLNWMESIQLKQGVVEKYMPKDNAKGRFLHYKITENSTTSKFRFYGFACDVEKIGD